MQPASCAASERLSWHELVHRQLREAFPDGPPDLPGLQAFLAAVSETYIATEDERRQLEHSLQRASEELAERNRRLEERIDQLTQLEQVMAEHSTELDQRNRNLTLLLNHVAQGFATVGLDGVVRAECSQAFARWFGKPHSDAPIWTMLAGDDPNLAAWIQLGFESLHSELMPIDVVLGQLPRRLVRNGRQLDVEYQAIGVPLTMVFVVVTDVTDELARERAEAAQRELIAVVDNAYRDRAGFLSFIHETSALVRALPGVSFAELKRHVHTVKGNAALFGVTSVAEVCHELENQMEAEGAAPDSTAWAVLVDTWQEFHDRVDALLQVSQHRSILVDWEEYQSVVASISEAEPSLAAQIRRWGQDATRPHLEHFAERAQQLARRLGKAELDIELRDNDVRIDGDRFAPLWSALIHTVRNAVDHGIEPATVRLARGKPARARMVFSTELQGGELVIEIRDDGSGIDWAAVAERATAMGLPAANRRDLIDAMLGQGLSTASEITQTSGRGLGMSALRATCAELGGRVELASEPGSGTTVRCCVPLPRSASRTRSHSLFRV
jgi:two-component system chemotaxis sensor kinase CheA